MFNLIKIIFQFIFLIIPLVGIGIAETIKTGNLGGLILSLIPLIFFYLVTRKQKQKIDKTEILEEAENNEEEAEVNLNVRST